MYLIWGEGLRHCAARWKVPVSIPGRTPWKFSSDLFLLSAFSGSRVHSASKKNECQGVSLDVKRVRRVQLTILPSKLCWMSN